MSARDELAQTVIRELPKWFILGGGEQRVDAHALADALIAEGWRKKPSEEGIEAELVRQHYSGTECGTNGVGGCSHCYGPSPMTAREIARVVLALMEEGQHE